MKIILVNVQEVSKKELKILMVETRTLTSLNRSGHNKDSESDFQIIVDGYQHHTRRRNIFEA